jgi:putative photosynthetic complex assembly protein
MSETDSKTFPKVPLIGAAGLVLFAFCFALSARLFDFGTTHVDYSSPVETRSLRFEDRADGSVAVFDAASNAVIETMQPGSSGFVRIVMRGLARERLAIGGSKEAAFELTRWDNGRLTISDPVTGHRVELVGFGPDNVRAFASLLTGSDTR